MKARYTLFIDQGRTLPIEAMFEYRIEWTFYQSINAHGNSELWNGRCIIGSLELYTFNIHKNQESRVWYINDTVFQQNMGDVEKLKKHVEEYFKTKITT